MSVESTGRGRVRFGVFDLDLSAGELYRNGSKVKLQEQPYQVLVVLLERPGEVVTREEICERLWPDGTFIEFDRSLNIAVNKLRDALGDSAENPRFVETVPRRGYRFIAPVEGAGKSARARWIAVAALAAGVFIAAGYWGVAGGITSRHAPSAPVPLTSYPGQELHPSLSPDGNQVTFSWNGPGQDNFDIYVKLIGPGEPIRLTKDPRQDFSPVWSPDGSLIAFRRVLGPRRAGVFVMPALGGAERQVAEGYMHVGAVPPDVSIGWTPDSRRLVMTDRVPTPDRQSLFLVDIDTGRRSALTLPASNSGRDTGPALSPDGRALAFVRGSNLIKQGIFVQELTDDFLPDGKPSRLTAGMLARTPPIWTPDGREILFSSANQTYGPQRLWKVSAIGSGAPEPLDSAGSNVTFPALSSESRRLVYSHGTRVLNVWRITIPASGESAGAPTVLIASTRADQWPQFSPDGKSIAFQSGRTGVHEIWRSDRDGKNVKQLTAFGQGITGSPRWSPDQQRIAFDSTGEGLDEFEIYVMDGDGSNRRRLTNHPARDIVPSWSQDGNWVYFTSNRTGRTEIWKAPVAGGEPLRVTKGGGRTAFESPDGRYLYFRKHYRQSLWRVPVAGGSETKVLSGIYGRDYAVTVDGIYFRVDTEPPEKSFIRYFGLSSGEISTLAEIPGRIFGLSVSPDRRQIIYSQVDYEDYDLMLVEDFQ